MTVLSDSAITEYVEKNLLKIEPYNPDCITPSGYDLEVEDFEIPPGEVKQLIAKSRIVMPADLISIPLLRTTYLFKGLVLSPGIIDAGFSGILRITVFNASKETIRKENGQLGRPVTLMFLKTDKPVDVPFGGRHSERNH